MDDMQQVSDIWTVILNWKQPEMTARCVETLRSSVDPSTIIVIDNGSGDGSASYLKDQLPEVVLLPLPHNLGFARAANIGVAHALQQGAWAVLLLNNDTLVAPGMVGHLARKLRTTPHAGLISAKVYRLDSPEQLWAIGGIFTHRRVINLVSGVYDAGQYDSFPLDFVYLCATLVRADVFREIGGFDEQFFMYYEDIDFCLRAQAAGYRVGLAPEAHAWHHGAGSTRDKPEQKRYYEACSRLLFFERHLSPQEKRIFFWEELRYVLAMTVRWVLAGQRRTARAYVRGCAVALTVQADRRRK